MLLPMDPLKKWRWTFFTLICFFMFACHRRPSIEPGDQEATVIADTNLACSQITAGDPMTWLEADYRSLTWQKIVQKVRMGNYQQGNCELIRLIRHYRLQTQTCTQRLLDVLEKNYCDVR